MQTFGALAILAVALVVLGLLFILCRKFVLWYWKLDMIEEHLQAIRNELTKEK